MLVLERRCSLRTEEDITEELVREAKAALECVLQGADRGEQVSVDGHRGARGHEVGEHAECVAPLELDWHGSAAWSRSSRAQST